MRIIFIILFLFLCAYVYSDYTLVCPCMDVAKAMVYSMNDEGGIKYSYTVDLGINAYSLVFSPDGHWGMAGQSYYTSLLDVSPEGKVKYLGKLDNPPIYSGPLSCISPDSSIGIYGVNFKVVNMNKNKTYKSYPGSGTYLGKQCAFSSLNNNIYSIRDLVYKVSSCGLYEFMIVDGVNIVETGKKYENFKNAVCDIEISPDGKTGIVFNLIEPQIAVFKIGEKGGFEIIQELYSSYKNRNSTRVAFTLDSKLVVLSYDSYLASYRVNDDSTLTFLYKTDLFSVNNLAFIALTPDGKYGITCSPQANGSTIIKVLRIYPDGTIVYLSDKDIAVSPWISDMAFLPPYKDYLTNSWLMY